MSAHQAAPERGLQLRHVTVGSGQQTIVEHLTLDAAPGSTLVITGPPGSGKSTLLATVAGLRPPRSGEVLLSGALIHPDLVGHDIGYAPQTPSVIGTLTAIENVALTLLAQAVPPLDAWAASAHHLSELGLPDALQNNLAEQLSGGQRQRVAFARATIGRPRLLVADDPTSELDPGTAERVLAIIRKIAEEGSSVVLSTTDPAVAGAGHQTLAL